MKYVRFFMSCCFSMLSVLTMADNVTVESISMQAGEERQIAIGLNNSERNYVSCQFDIVVPQGFSIPSNSVMLDEERSNSHQYSFVKISDDRYRLMVYSMPVKPFGGNSGSIVYLKLQCENNVKAGTYSFSVVTQKFTDSDGKKYVFDDCRFSVTVEGIVVKGNSYRRKYGEENPHFGYTTDKAISGVPDVVCEASPKSPVGTYPIKVLKGSVTNSNVTFIDGELIIEEALLTITADNKRMVRGEQVPEFTATYAGFKNGETASVLDKLPQFECDATESSEPGEYAIGVSGAEAQNYVISYENGILTIVDPDPIIVTVKNVSRKYGDPNPSAFEYTVEGGTLNGVPLVNCNATQESPVGKYDITIEKGTVSNYNVSFVKGTLTIEKAPLTILADDKEMLIGDSLPVFTATYQGFKNNETEGILTKVPKMECDATSLSPGGSYPISVFGAEAQNYEIGYESGLLTIIDPPLTVTATDCDREYGEPNPVFGYSVEGGRLIGEPILSTEATVESQVGSYGITIERGGIINANVTFVGGMLNVGKAPLQVKADDITIRQGDEMPPFTASYQGFKLADNEASLLKQPGFSCEVKNSSQIGEFAITVSGAESNNYDISYSVGVLRVVEAPVVIKVNNKVRLYGDENPHFDYTIEGGELKGLPVVRCEATPASSVGEYEIVIEKGTVTNNEVTFINGKLRIDKAPLTITADDKQMVLGEAIPEYTATYSGFKNGEDASDLEQVPQFSCSATSYSEPGEYVIDVSGAQTSNYAINYVSGSLTILPPEPIIADVSNPVAGGLASQIEKAGLSTMKVNEMKVTGLLNGTDIKCIREMIIRGCLTSLDIEETSIVSGGEPYYNEYSIEEWTQNDVVGHFMFSNCKNLISIKLPKTVTLIELAFDGCDNLLRLDIPESCQEVGVNAISGCPSLTVITIPSCTQTFHSYNCTFCPSLKSIDVAFDNQWLTSKDGVLFSKDMDKLIKYPMGKTDESYTVPNDVRVIEDRAFSSASFSNIVLPERLEAIGSSAFSECDKILEFTIPNSVRSIGMSAFSGCDNLEKLYLPEGLTEIRSFLANGCKNLVELSLPNTIQAIGYDAFAHCESLSEIYCNIPDIEKVKFDLDYSSGKANAFDDIDIHCRWHVVEGTKNKYTEQPKERSWWIDSWTIVDDLIQVVVKGNSYRRKYGEENPHFGYTTDKAISGVPDVVCEASPQSPVGTYPIKVLKGSVTNSNVTFVDGELIIEEAPLTITADNKRMVRGEQVPEFTATYAGFKNGETASVLNKLPRFECNATESSEPGEYAIGVSGAEAQNYAISYKNGILTIVDPDPIIVTVKNASRKYGDPNPSAFEYTVEGGTLNGIPLVNCNATQESPVGKYDITIEKGTVSNYNVSFVKGTLTIEKAPLTILADDKEMLIGDSLPVFTATYRGFKNNETEGILTKMPKMECDATSLSPGGSYPISVFGAEAQNYEIEYEGGMLTIIDPPLTVTATDCNREYGEPNPVFGYSVEGGRLIGEPILSTEATVESQVGSYGITIERGGIINANVTFVGGMLNVGKAPLTITADDKQMVFGETLPEYTATYSGFKNGEDASDLEQAPQFSCSATSYSEPGVYVIDVSGAQTSNYAINYVSGSLTILPPEPVIAAVSNPVAGGLASQIEKAGFSTIKVNEMKVTGLLNGTDIKCIREMIIKGCLTSLDIEETSIVSGGEPYYDENRTDNDVVGQFMFSDCKNLISIKLPKTVTLIEYAFDGCDNLLRLDIPESCQEVGVNAISDCPSLTTITIPAATQTVDSYNCMFCPSLQSIEVDPANKWLASLDGVLFTKNMDELVKYPMGKQDTLFVAPKSIVSINDYAFSDALLQSVELPEGLLTIGTGAFDGCFNLVKIDIPQTVASIDMNAFGHCENLRELSLPKDVMEVSDCLAEYCRNLSYLRLPGSIQSVGSFAFGHCKSLTRIDSYIDNLQSVFFETDLEGGVDAFEGIPEDCVWHVKVNTKEAYLAQPWWIDSWTIIDDLICPGIVSSTISPIEKDDSWYTTDGIRLIGKPTIPGLYIYQGRKVVIK